MNENELAIEVSGLTKRFGDVVALDGVDLQVRPGTVYGLLGPNGAGKTTTVRVLTTILAPDAGEARVLGLDVRTEADAVRRRIGLAGQYAAVDEQLTARENLELVGRLTHQPRSGLRDRADELLRAFDLVAAADRPLKTFSGGMRRRLDLAASLVHRPPVLFLDEPTTGLDPRSRSDLWGLIRTLVSGGTTVLLTTQYLEEADVLAERIAVVDHGRVIAEGTSEELKAQMGATVLELSFSDHAAAVAAVDDVASVVPGAEADGVLVRVTVPDGTHTALEVLRTLDARQIDVAGMTLREPSLDDVFLSLTGRPAEAEADGDGPDGDTSDDTLHPAPTGGSR